MNGSNRLRDLWLLLPMFLLGCDDRAGPAPFISSDSLGVHLVEFHWDGVPTSWQVEERAEWVIGDGAPESGGVVLHGVVGARMLSEEVVVIAEASSQQVIRVDLGTGGVARWGGAGDGPEEFRGLSGVFDLGDGGIGVHDGSRGRYVELDGEGRLIRDTGLPALGPDRPTVILVGEGTAAPTPYVALVTGFPRAPVTGPYRGTGPVVPLAAQEDTIALIRGAETFAGDGGAGFVAFGRTTLLAGGSDGLWIGDTEDPAVEFISGTGQASRIVRWTSERSLALTEERRDRLWAELEERAREPERSMIGRFRSILPFAERKPAFGALVAGPEDRIWVGEPIPPEILMLEEPWPAQEWVVVDFSEESAVRLITPPGFQLLQAGEDFVLGLHRNEVGIETVRLHRIH